MTWRKEARMQDGIGKGMLCPPSAGSLAGLAGQTQNSGLPVAAKYAFVLLSSFPNEGHQGTERLAIFFFRVSVIDQWTKTRDISNKNNKRKRLEV